MIFRKDEDNLFIRFDDGEDFFETLYTALEENKYSSGVFLSATGMLRKFEIGWFNIQTGQYERESYNEPYELLSLCGNLSMKDSKAFAHFHASLSGKDHSVIGGHLFSGKVCNTVELFFKPFKHQLKRLQGITFQPLGF